MRKYFAIGAVALGLLAACGDDDSEQTQPPATEPTSEPTTTAAPAPSSTVVPESLDGTTFTTSELTVGGQPMAAAEGSTFTIGFADGHVNADFGCNGGSGAYRIEEGKLTVEQFATTKIGCEGQLATQDGLMSELITSAPTVQHDGDQLTLTTEHIVFVGTAR